MTRTALDPSNLKLFYPRASQAHPVKLRLVVQALHYDVATAQLSVVRFPNLPRLHTEIDLDGVGPTADSPLLVDVSQILLFLLPAEVTPGAAVSILGFFDGYTFTAVECFAMDASCLLGDTAATWAAMATLPDL